MKKALLINLAALFCAVTLFSGSVVFAASQIQTTEEEPKQDSGYADFMQTPDLGIADLLQNTGLLTSSEADASLGSDENPSSPSVSSDLPSSRETGASVRPPVSSEKESSREASSAELSSANSSALASSDIYSSAALSELSSVPVSSEESSELSSSLPDSSEEEVTSDSSLESSSIETFSSQESSSEESSDYIDSSEELSVDEESSSENLTDSSDMEEPESEREELLRMVAGTVQREIVGVNTPPNEIYKEAYKAQAVAAHTYMEFHKRRTGSYPQMSYADPDPKVLALVDEVLEDIIYYNGEPINAFYHAASGGYTQSAVYVWGNDVPYLKGVPSEYDDYNFVYQISASELEDKLMFAGINVMGDPSEWFDLNGASYSDGGFVDKIQVGDQKISARHLRENILGSNNLRSPKILNIEYDGENLIFTTKGYGHGVGLSQQGALGYAAKEGYTYQQILNHYYQGVEIR